MSLALQTLEEPNTKFRWKKIREHSKGGDQEFEELARRDIK